MKTSTLLATAGGVTALVMVTAIGLTQPAKADLITPGTATPPAMQRLWCCGLNDGICFTGTGTMCLPGNAPYPDEQSCKLGCGAGGPGGGGPIGGQGSSSSF